MVKINAIRNGWVVETINEQDDYGMGYARMRAFVCDENGTQTGAMDDMLAHLRAALAAERMRAIAPGRENESRDRGQAGAPAIFRHSLD